MKSQNNLELGFRHLDFEIENQKDVSDLIRYFCKATIIREGENIEDLVLIQLVRYNQVKKPEAGIHEVAAAVVSQIDHNRKLIQRYS